MQVVDVVLATTPDGDDVVYFKDAERELVATPVALAFLLAEPDVRGLPLGYRNVDVVAAGDLGVGRYQPVRNRLPMDCCRRMLTNSTALGDMSTPIHCRAKFCAATWAEEGQLKGAGSENSPPLLPNESAQTGESPSPDLVFTLADLRARPDGWVCLARGFAVWEARIAFATWGRKIEPQ